ncbi:MAG: amino acid decarboxylase, partial [Bradyrhizobium sp.]
MESLPHGSAKVVEETLDPEDWSDAQTVARQAVDDAIAYLRDIRDRPVWQNMPDKIRRTFQAS